MTAREPQQEYTIDILKVDKILERYVEDFATFSTREKRETIKEIHDILISCSRPHPATALDYNLPVETCNICDLWILCDRKFGSNGYPPCVQKAACKARKDEREKVLKKLKDWLGSDREFCHRIGAIPAYITHACILDKIESLRQQDKGGQEKNDNP